MDVQRFRRSFYVPPDVSASPSVLRQSGARDPQGRNLTVTLSEAAAENVTAFFPACYKRCLYIIFLDAFV